MTHSPSQTLSLLRSSDTAPPLLAKRLPLGYSGGMKDSTQQAKQPAQQTPARPPAVHTLKAGMVGMGMIFDETYRPFFEGVHGRGIYDPAFGVCDVPLVAVASRT